MTTFERRERRGAGARVAGACLAGIGARLALAALLRAADGARGMSAAPVYPNPVCETCGRVLDGSASDAECVPEGAERRSP
jgi:hypothetical protein